MRNRLYVHWGAGNAARRNVLIVPEGRAGNTLYLVAPLCRCESELLRQLHHHVEMDSLV